MGKFISKLSVALVIPVSIAAVLPLTQVEAKKRKVTRYEIRIHGLGMDNSKKGDRCSLAVGEGPVRALRTRLSRYRKHVCYNAEIDPHSRNRHAGVNALLNRLNRFCRRDRKQQCRIFCHSLGCYVTQYVIDKYNDGFRYDVHSVMAVASAQGGSEVVPVKFALEGKNLEKHKDLKATAGRLIVTRARSIMNHNDTNGAPFYHTAGRTLIPNVVGMLSHLFKGLWRSFWTGAVHFAILPGFDDNTVAFHSAFGLRKPGAYYSCGSASRRFTNHHAARSTGCLGVRNQGHTLILFNKKAEYNSRSREFKPGKTRL